MALSVYHTDGLGSVRAITDAGKAIVQTYESDEFGVPVSANGALIQPFGYTGEPTDVTAGLLYLRARRYDPQLGRFTTRDTFAGLPAVPATLNRFTYTQNRPTVLTDPSGRDPDGNKDREYQDECFKEWERHGRLIGIQCINLIIQLNGQVEIPTSTGPVLINVPVAAPSPPTGGGGSGENDWDVTISPRGHGARHLVGTGLSQTEVEAAIVDDVRKNISPTSKEGDFFIRRLNIQGQTIEYRV